MNLFSRNLSFNNISKSKVKTCKDFFNHLYLKAHFKMEFQMQQTALLYSCTPRAPR